MNTLRSFRPLLVLAALPLAAAAQVGSVVRYQHVNEALGGFGGALQPEDDFGTSLAGLGDVDGDGVPDVAVGAPGDDDGGVDRGALWILFLNADGTVAFEQKISATAGGFGGVLDAPDNFGRSVAALGDLDGDGIPDLAVGAPFDDDGGTNQGAVWILFPEGSKHRRRFIPDLDSSPEVVLNEPADGGREDARVDDAATLRNGSGVNELALTSACAPRAGEEWQAWVDVSAHPGARASLVVVSERPLRGTPTLFGELLIDVVSKKPLYASLVHSSNLTDVHEFSISRDALGIPLSLQALIIDGKRSTLTNAIDLVIGKR
jgi:hypothetical protein